MRTRYAFAGAFLGCFVVTGLVYALLGPGAQATFADWASTNVANLEHEPVLPLLLSAFVAPGYLLTWPVLIALALFGANRAVGNARIALVCLAAHVIGTLVSEGIVAYRVSHGALPPADRFIIDVGPSYVVVAAVAVAILYGGWLARAAALLDLAVLTFAGGIFSGLFQLQVAAVGHTTAIATGAIAGSLAVWQRRARQQRAAHNQSDEQQVGLPPAGPGAASPAIPGTSPSQAGAAAGRRAADQADQPRPPA